MLNVVVDLCFVFILRRVFTRFGRVGVVDEGIVVREVWKVKFYVKFCVVFVCIDGLWVVVIVYDIDCELIVIW